MKKKQAVEFAKEVINESALIKIRVVMVKGKLGQVEDDSKEPVVLCKCLP